MSNEDSQENASFSVSVPGTEYLGACVCTFAELGLDRIDIL